MERLEDSSITAVPGFLAAGVHCGLKSAGEKDLALILSSVPCRAAGVFTANRVKAAPVLYDQEVLARNPHSLRAVVINSGCANACTGKRGLQDARKMAELAAKTLNLPKGELPPVLVMSTGVIGKHLPMEKIAAGIEEASARLSPEGGHDAARSIMTTDTRPKEAALRLELDGATFTIAGMAKGAGMIHPQMATMLSLIVTDAAISTGALQNALRQAVEVSFNMVTVDGDTSTNDTVLILANGLAGNPEIARENSPGYRAFKDGLIQVATDLSKMIARDGEGATKFVEINVHGAPSFVAARQAAKAIANSSLVKTALYGEDANWGRVLAAVGYSGVEIDPDRLALWFGDLQLVKGGQPFNVDEARAKAILSHKDISITVDLGLGPAQATVWTCDLSHEYVSINAHYRT